LKQGVYLPEGAYAAGIFFACLCTVALWWGFAVAVKREPKRACWIDSEFDVSKLFYAGAFLCAFGFFFQWKLMTLPEEMLASTRWTGAPVKYLFLGSVFKFGFISLWLLYLTGRKLLVPRMLLFIIPSLMLELNAAVLLGRRAEMMHIFSYIVIGIWFARRISIPRWFLITGLVMGLVLINAIGMYRAIMLRNEEDLGTRLKEAANADYLSVAEKKTQSSSAEVKNYIFFRQSYVDEGIFNYGATHWNMLIFNYVPGQIVGRELKNSLMIPLESPTLHAEEEYGYVGFTGSTSTGYLDAYGSFGWLGFIKFWLVGWIMGTLYRHAMNGAFLAQLLYIYGLGTAMHVVTHQTNDILVRIWVYFFVLAYPVFYLAKIKEGSCLVATGTVESCH
ncbi:MAG: oligosaccharide repeat unit polymerase, partial [Deltaproteobacteria bacterium]|nr:oligosaccharide repeat unit polymerase [Deltaproteobacteria bacterium]